MGKAQAWMEQHDITLADRYSAWEYRNTAYDFLAGKKAAERVDERLSDKVRSAGTVA